MSWLCLAPSCHGEFEETYVTKVGKPRTSPVLCDDPTFMCGSAFEVSAEPHDVDVVSPQELQGLLQEQNYVRVLDLDPCSSEAEPVRCSEPELLQPRALTTPPITFEIYLDDEHQPGQPVSLHGPHGSFEVMSPPDSKPGEKLTYEIGPRPEFEITAPSNSRPGEPILITHEGSMLRLCIPENCHPGETFLVEPPTIMVKVPEGVSAGRWVYFIDSEYGWLRARVPSELLIGCYFGARLPPPNTLAALKEKKDDIMTAGEIWSM